MNVVLDKSVVAAVAGDQNSSAYNAVSKASKEGWRRWLYVGQAADMVSTIGRESLAEISENCEWLAALAGEARLLSDPPAALAKACDRIDGDTVVLADDPSVLERVPGAITPDKFLTVSVPESGMQFINLKAQQAVIREELEDRLHRVLHHGRYIMGAEIKELEAQLASYVGVGHCIASSSGTDTLLVALMALDVGPGDEVITTPYTWISTAEVIALLGATPVFVDIDPNTYNIDAELIEQAVTTNTKAIMPVGIFGQCADMDAINVIAAKHGLPVIEDAAQSFGATYKGKKSCALSRIGSTSFFPAKPFGCYGDGGALFTDDEELADRMRWIRVHGQEKAHCHPVIGINGRFDTMQAAVLLAKLPHFDDEIEARDRVGARYTTLINERLGSDSGVVTPVIDDVNTSVYAQYTLQVEDPGQVRNILKENGIPSVSYYSVPLHLQPVFSGLGKGRGSFPVTESVASRGVSLPMSPWLTEAEQDRVVEVLAEKAMVTHAWGDMDG